MPVDNDTRDLLRSVGANVTRLRKRAGWTQAGLAELVDCEPNYLQKVEYGTAVPSLQTLVKIARALDVQIGVLFRTTKPRQVKRGRPPKKKSTP